MGKKINLAELLKGCKKGMKLDCAMYEDVYFDYVDELNIIHCYIQHENYKTSITFNQHGTPNSDIKSKCVIFPKGKTTWEGFVSPCKFKVGDRITDKNKFIYRITEITDKGYKLHDLKTTFITFEEADLYFVKVVDVFDITTLKPFDWVLVRDRNDEKWGINLFGYYNKSENQYYCIGFNDIGWDKCIPYEANKELLGTTNDCDEYYKTWE